MRLLVANHSGYPRVGEGADAQRLRRAYASRERGGIDDDGYADVRRDYTAEIVAEQRDAGCDVVTDGRVHWYDAITHLAGRLDGVVVRGLIRWFDTNTYVRRAEVTGELSGGFGLADDYAFASATTDAPLKAVATGPYTLAAHSILGDDAPYADRESLALAFAEVLAGDVAALEAAGCTSLQVEEPSLLRHPDDAHIVRRALDVAVAGRSSLRVSLVTYFGDATPLIDELLAMPVDLVGLDLVYGAALVDVLAERGSDLPLVLGIADGRNTMPEDVGAAAKAVRRIAESCDRRGVDELHLQPSCCLEHLPRDRAKRKLERLRAVADEVIR